VHVPRAWSSNKNVVVVGTPRSVAIARKHIERILENINNAEERHPGDGCEDGEQDEEVEEEWMKNYIYKRE
jgi:rRNA processing protein Krr1/Pno1